MRILMSHYLPQSLTQSQYNSCSGLIILCELWICFCKQIENMNKISGYLIQMWKCDVSLDIGPQLETATQDWSLQKHFLTYILFKMLKLHFLLHYSQILKTLPSCLPNKKVIAFSEWEILWHHSYSIFSLDHLINPTNKLHSLQLKLRKIKCYILHHHDE